MKHPTDEEIEKFIMPLGMLPTPQTVAIVTEVIKWARDQQPKWISVNDSLPEKGINVLCMRNSHMIVARLTKEYDRPDWYALNNWIHGVTHWMPLPEGPSNSPKPTTRNE